MLHVVLHQPEIPPNTGNVIRLCANTGARLHLIKPLAFSIDDVRLKRAGLDYHEHAALRVHEDFASFVAAACPSRIFALSTRGTRRHTEVEFGVDDAIVFGSETRGLPQSLIDSLPDGHCVRLPMRPHNRSLNLSNAVAVVVFEAWRQAGFDGAV